MRVRAGVFARAQSIHRQIGLRSFVLLPAAVVTATAMHAPVALARPSDIHWDGASPRFQAERQVEAQGDEDARPRRRSSRDARRRGHRPARAANRRHAWEIANLSTGRRASLQRSAPRIRQAAPRLAALSPAAAEIVPLEQRSLVATHPLAPDPLFPAPELPTEPTSAALAAPPRCRGAHPSTFALAVASFGHGFWPSEPAMVEGAWPHCRGARNPQSSVRLASLGPTARTADPAASPSLSGDSIYWRASADCLASPLRTVLALVAESFGPLTVNSTCRSPSHNARVGGARRSQHLTGNAVDFRVRGQYGDVLAFLLRQRSVGGYKHYGSGVFHIDTGPRRTWGGRRARRA